MRHRLIGSILVCLFLASIFAARFSANSPILRVNESATKFSLHKAGAVVSLAIKNSRSSALTARIKLELIDARDAIRATAMSEVTLPPGASVSPSPLVKTGAGNYDVGNLLWHRLRYEIAAVDTSGKESDQISGIISLSEITPDVFRLLVLAPQEVGKEAKYTIRARTLHPLTGKPVTGVNMEARMAYEEDDEERELKSSGVTNPIGEALLEFKLPGPLKADDVEVKVVARREGFLQEAKEEVGLLHMNQIMVSADKPLYQPGQKLRVRILALDRDRKAWANVDGSLKINDMESTTHFRADFKTSRFGVANVDWKIPDGARLGDYNIEAHIGEQSPRRVWGSIWIKISRYDLPNFVVNVKPDRAYHLPGQNAEVEVRADYLFGQPVKRGRVRVVRETERRWDYREQKWETEESAKYEGALDDEGRFIARIDLTEEHEDFEPSSYSRFRDLRYAAYLTDPSTGRAEQRRFDLRITKDPIHVYLIERGRTSQGLPLQFFISTFYADGAPAQCEVAINQTFGDEDGDESKSGVFGESGSLDINVPMDAIKGSVRAELKIYPNLMAHALEGIEGILQRPYGCAEQTISSTYPNVMILRYLEPQSEKLSAPMRKIAEKARRYAQAGYERLLGYRAENGGFGYWGHGEADLALTAYALRFLNDAGDFIGVDEDVIADARKFILSRQETDGRWLPRYWSEKEDAKRMALNTAFIARVLAMEKSKETKAGKDFAAAFGRALDYLAKRVEEIDEPYLIASYALAAMDAGEKSRADKAVAKLRTLAREEAGTSYWNLESNTPFYGWGLAGRIETTALAVNALKRDGETGRRGDGAKSEDLVNRGLLFLMRNKDRYGVWLSTQATINVLDTLISLNAGEIARSGVTGGAEIVVNGKRVSSVSMPPAGSVSDPITVDLSSFLNRGNNRVEIRRSGDATRA